MDFFQCIPLAKAKEMIYESLEGRMVGSETVFLADALGKIAAESIKAKEDLPPFSRSTVDGFAVRSADTFGANEGSPSLFSLVGEVIMGEKPSIKILSGQAAVIPTGGMLPAGADAVVMLEYTENVDSQTLQVLKMAAPGENIIHKGEDIRNGKAIVNEGQKLVPSHIGLLAACGCTYIPVRNKVKAAILSTGDELVDIDKVPNCGQMRDINSYSLAAMLSEMGCEVIRMGIVKDDYDQFLEFLTQAVQCGDIVIVSGGSSVGVRDYTVKAIAALDTPGVLFHGIAVKPGKPTIFGMVGNVPVFGLPGHPVAAMIVCEQLVKEAVRIISGQVQSLGAVRIRARINRNVASTPGRDDFISVQLTQINGEYIATPLLGKSGLINLMAQADGMLHIPADKSGLYEGDLAEILLINRERG